MNNTDSIEISAQTVDEAIQQALTLLNAAEDDVVIEVLATPRSGMLGLGQRSARVRVTKRPALAATSGVTEYHRTQRCWLSTGQSRRVDDGGPLADGKRP